MLGFSHPKSVSFWKMGLLLHPQAMCMREGEGTDPQPVWYEGLYGVYGCQRVMIDSPGLQEGSHSQVSLGPSSLSFPSCLKILTIPRREPEPGDTLWILMALSSVTGHPRSLRVNKYSPSINIVELSLLAMAWSIFPSRHHTRTLGI